VPKKLKPLDGDDNFVDPGELIDDALQEPRLETINQADAAAMVKEMWDLGFVCTWGALDTQQRQIMLHFVDRHAHE